MTTILASLCADDILPGPADSDADGRHLMVYVDSERLPQHTLLLGQLLDVVDLDEGLRILIIGAPGLKSPVCRAMFGDQHRILEAVLLKDVPSTARRVLTRQDWCQGSPDLDDGLIYVRFSSASTTDVSDLSSGEFAQVFAGFSSEVPVLQGSPTVFVKGALLGCSVDMFRVDMPLLSSTGTRQDVYTRAYGLNAARVIRFVKHS
ncbi:hypothetical protein C8R47DRAFT_1297777 [Mycena vitilis]|nr:hypothetical protein C8R47DRAFT_1297777 [Mycena vitilis]